MAKYIFLWGIGLGLIGATDKQLLVHEETTYATSNAIVVVMSLVLPRLLILFKIPLPCVLRTMRRWTQALRDRIEELSRIS